MSGRHGRVKSEASAIWTEVTSPPPERLAGGLFAARLARVAGWLVAPPASRGVDPPRPGPRLHLAPPAPEPQPPEPHPPRPLVAVLGLASRAGASTVARALAARLARLDPAGAAVLFTADPPRAPISAAAAGRLVRLATEAGADGARAAGRLCVVPLAEPVAPLAAPRPAPLVVDLGHGIPAEGAVALADHVVLVCPPDVEPALAVAVEASLRGSGHSVSLVASRVLGDPPAELGCALAIPESRIAAQLTLACREPRGALGAAVAELAERSLAEVRR